MCSTGDENRLLCGGETAHVARKQHRCIECGGPIPVGTRYLRLKGVWEDIGPDTVRYHLECDVLWKFCVEELCGGEGGRVLGELRNEIHEYGMAGDGDEPDGHPNLIDIVDAIREGYERQAAA